MTYFSGKRWRYIPGRLSQIEAGPSGVVWGVSKAGYIYYREGVGRRRPIGTRWARVAGRLRYVAAGCIGVFGVSRSGKIWRYRGMSCHYICYVTIIGLSGVQFGL